MDLTAANVNAVLTDCLLTDEEVVQLSLEGADSNKHEELVEAGHLVIAKGVMLTVGLHPERLESHRDNVASMLDQLPDSFKPDGGGGMSFLNMCERKDGVLWGEHRDMDTLAVLAIALDLGAWLLPRQMWEMLPGGMPYFVTRPQEATT